MKRWWKAWGGLMWKFIMVAISIILSLIPFLVKYFTLSKNLSFWVIVPIILAAGSLIVFGILEYHTYSSHRVYSRNDKNGINKYMHDWIEHAGLVAIWTRDMTWANNDETSGILEGKASRNELILCMPRQNEQARKLAEKGAKVFAYGDDILEFPNSRFTIVNYGRDGSRVAVGREEGDTHVIDEFDLAGHPAFSLAEDLVSIARALQKDRKSE